jgi:hypothetical protein
VTLETLFSICSRFVLPGWLLLIVAPRWKGTTRLISSCLIPLPLACVYLWLIVTHFRSSTGGFGSLAQVAQLFANPYLLVAGWIHYLAFDLFIGSWEVRDAQRLSIHHLWVVPCLLLTFLLGPIGLLLYFVLRWSLRREFLVGAIHV